MSEEMANEMELHIWQGDYGLPSVDHSCLAVMAYCKFSRVPVKFLASNNPWQSPTGDLPILQHGEVTAGRVAEIFNHLRKQNWGTDFDLTCKQSADILAYSALMEEKLAPALQHTWWIDSRVYSELTRPWFQRTISFPLNYYIPLKKHKDVYNRLFHSCNSDQASEQDKEAQIYKDAKECLNNLSAKLGDNRYFFGNMPTSLDAIVFGYLAPLLKAPFPSSQLQNHLKGCLNLCRLCNNIVDTFFPLDPEDRVNIIPADALATNVDRASAEAAAQQARAEQHRKRAAESTEFPNRRRNLMVSGAVALTAMMGYAFMNGLVQVDLSRRDDADNGNQSTTGTQHRKTYTPQQAAGATDHNDN